eukprot:TRINITY_DN2820_c0_g1_i2.p1 TRINITY_DN2820_c0_g1~~TRINITY_DN2820_c0_g1_i2.p1  ORF type:complete len:190 (-),score=52.82 TRINITY_DN2820_c0_g1_i2:61-630(-)
MGYRLRNSSKTFSTPRRPWEKERIKAELQLVGEFGLKNKREVYRVKYTLGKIRKAARNLLTLPEDHPKRQFEGAALLRRLHNYGILDESKNTLDAVLSLGVENLLDRRLQTLVFKNNIADSIHESRVKIRQGHIRVGRQTVNVPSFMVRVKNENGIDISFTSSENSGRYGRISRRHKGTQEVEEEEEAM